MQIRVDKALLMTRVTTCKLSMKLIPASAAEIPAASAVCWVGLGKLTKHYLVAFHDRVTMEPGLINTKPNLKGFFTSNPSGKIMAMVTHKSTAARPG